MSEHIGILARMLEHMRTTVILPDELYRLAKERAREDGRTFTSLLEEALRREIRRRDLTDGVRADVILAPPSGIPGGEPLIDLTDKDAVAAALDEDDFTVQQIQRARRTRA